MTEPITRVIFRVFEKEVIALFPDIPATNAYDCESYMHIGQHGAADPRYIMSRSRRPRQGEELALHRELMELGYKLRECYKLPANSLELRRQAMRDLAESYEWPSPEEL